MLLMVVEEELEDLFRTLWKKMILLRTGAENVQNETSFKVGSDKNVYFLRIEVHFLVINCQDKKR